MNQEGRWKHRWRQPVKDGPEKKRREKMTGNKMENTK